MIPGTVAQSSMLCEDEPCSYDTVGHLRKFGLQTLLTGQPVAALPAAYGYGDSPKGLPASQVTNNCEPMVSTTPFHFIRFGRT